MPTSATQRKRRWSSGNAGPYDELDVTEFRIVVQRTQGEGCAAAPASHHLRGHQFLAFGFGCVGLQVLTKRSHSLVQLAKDHITSISPQRIRRRYGRCSSHLIGVAKDKLARLQRLFMGICPRNAGPFNRRMADPVFESESLSLIW